MPDRSRSCDFPAAHSMDTTWFAVDRDGNVALFDSGEAGAVPDVVADEYSPAEGLLEGVAKGEAIFDPAAYAALSDTAHVAPAHLRFSQSRRAPLLVFLTDTPETKEAPRRVEGHEGGVQLGRGVSLGERRRRRVRGHPRQRRMPGLLLVLAGTRDDLAGAFYMYRHTCENWVSGPYARASSPSMPANAGAMPDELLEHAVRFDGRFAELPSFQPAELWACASWMPGWLATDKKTVRPFSGQEDDFEDAKTNLEGMGGSRREGGARPATAGERRETTLPRHLAARCGSARRRVFGGSARRHVFGDQASPAILEEASREKAPAETSRKPWWKIW